MTFTMGDPEVSFDANDHIAATAAERRRNARHATVLQIAKLSTDRCEELCILRDISSHGLRAEVYYPMNIGDRVSFELKTGRRVSGRVIWADGKSIGVEFDIKIPVFSVLAHQTLDELGYKARQPRLRTDAPARLYIDDNAIPARLCNVSQAGTSISVDRILRVGARCEIALEGLGRRKAIVRWFRNGEAGVLFVQPMTYPEFAAWRQMLARVGDRGSVAMR
jgi:hypothetical protein